MMPRLWEGTINGGIVVAALWLFGWISLLVHEGGHIIAGKLVGVRIMEVRLGTGRRTRAVRWGETIWYWQLFPRGGWVMRDPRSGAISRFREFCFTAGGPIATALLLVLLIWLWHMFTSPPTVFVRPLPSLVEQLLKVFGMMEAATLYIVLAPARCRMYGQETETDGLQMWKLFFGRKTAPEPSEAQRLFQKAFDLAQDGRGEEALETAQKAVQACTPDEREGCRFVVADLLMQTRRHAEAAEAYREELRNLEPGHPWFAHYVDSFATATQTRERSMRNVKRCSVRR